MSPFNQDELEGLVESLRDHPGFITAAVVPAGSGRDLIERIRENLEDLVVEVETARRRPAEIGAHAAQLGQSGSGCVLILKLDEPDLFSCEEETVRFWSELNYQREALGTGTVRTCLLLSEETEQGLALVADDLWDWTTIFRFPEAIKASVRTVEDSEALVWSDQEIHRELSHSDLAVLRSQWQRARDAELPSTTFVEHYAAPLFLALPSTHHSEATQVWKHGLNDKRAVESLPPEIRLLVARKMMVIAKAEGFDSHRDDLVQLSLDAAESATVHLGAKAARQPEAFKQALAAALSTSAKLFQDAGRFQEALRFIERCIDLLDPRSDVETDSETEALFRAHVQRRWTLLFLQRAQDNHALPLPQQVEALKVVDGPALDDEMRSNALGAALGLSITSTDNRVARASAGLFASWVLSHDYRLNGPPFTQVLKHDPVGYCRSLELLMQTKARHYWKKLLVEPLIQEWASAGPVSATVGETLAGWLLHFQDTELNGDVKDQEDQLRSWAVLQRIAVRVTGHRYDPDLLRVFCQYLVSFSDLDWHSGYWRHLALETVGFMLRWSYQEAAIGPLAAIAGDPESPEPVRKAARNIAGTLRQAELPEALRREEITATRHRQEESIADRLKRGQPGLLQSWTDEEFAKSGAHHGVAELAGDPEVPDLSRGDQEALESRLRALIRTGRVRDDGGISTYAGAVFDTWIPWLARCNPRAWWDITVELAERQIGLPAAQWALQQFPVLGIWPTTQVLARRIEETVVLATGRDGERLRGNLGLCQLIRWALHLEDSVALLRCFEALAQEKEFTDDLLIYPIPLWVMEWVIDLPTFMAAGERRRAATNDVERRLWFIVERAFVDHLPPNEALAWCREVVALAALGKDLRWLLVDQLTSINDLGALELLIGEGGVADSKDSETQSKILFMVKECHGFDYLEARFPRFVEDLTPMNRGVLLFETGRTEDLRQWGRDLFSRATGMLPLGAPTDDPLPFTWSRKALHQWARLEPGTFLDAVKRIGTSTETTRFIGREWSALLEAILIVWQECEPFAAAEARAKLATESMLLTNWTEDEIPIHIHTLWDPELSTGPEHRELRLRWLRSCTSDKDIAHHALAARINGMLSEVESIGKELLAAERQLDRALGVSLLAWHPDGDLWLGPLSESDPSTWVRGHAEWAIAVCRRDRVCCEIYREAVGAASWLEQQARLELLVPLALPTFLHWPGWDDTIADLVDSLSHRRKALLIDFVHSTRRGRHWKERIVGRDLERFCRGEDISSKLEVGEKCPPWQGFIHR